MWQYSFETPAGYVEAPETLPATGMDIESRPEDTPGPRANDMEDLESTTTASVPTDHRLELIEELFKRYGSAPSGPRGMARRFRFFWKKYAWTLVIGGTRVIKRGLDISASLLLFLCLSPVLLPVALIIKVTDGGPVLYWQTRVGSWGREFPFPKFRSMVQNADALKDALMEQSQHEDKRTFKMKDDPRITPIGRIIRKLSIDELPQLWCVLKGDMSLVGPRPPLPSEVARYTLAQRRRLDVLPGLTCIWQVSGRSEIPFPKQLELDLQYIESQSLWLDIKLLLKTIPAVLSGRGAY